VAWSSKSVLGYEALMRSREPGFGNPMVLLESADKLGRLHELGRRVRRLCAEAIASREDDICLLVNLHPVELDDDDLYSPDAPLTKVARRVVLEITERAKLETVPEVESRIAKLRAAGFRVAIDDIGAGYSGLTSFTLLRPDFVKIDMALVRNIHQDPVKRRLTGLLVQLCQDLEIGVIAEGVEIAEERDALLALGCSLLQGYLFAKPAAPPPEPKL
jgi:EAL domain-containing protein (putative c-di-GMP-specific phosphodiesterase class I)